MEETSEKETFAESLKTELDGFTGTTKYHRNWLGMHYTDGIEHLANRARAYWLIDAIASWQYRMKSIDLQIWELAVAPDCSAHLIGYIASVDEAIVQQKIDYTDFPLKSIELWVEGGVLFLPSEY